MTKDQRSIRSKLYKDKHDRLAIAQSPNLPLTVWLVTFLLAKLLPTGNLQDLCNFVSFGALFTWSWLEIFYAVNYFRRLLGVVVIVVSVFNRVFL